MTFDHILKYDGIVHLAALSGLSACEENQMDAVEKNVLTAMNVFNLAWNAGIPVVFTSSQAGKEPTSSKYASVKWTCEQIANIYNKAGANIYILRLANVYGGIDYLIKKQTCVKQFITKYKAELPLEIHGDGSQKRDFVHVADVCNAIMKCFRYLPEDKSPMDIGTGISTSIMDLQSMFPIHGVEFQEVRYIGTDSSIANIADAEEKIKFKAKRKLETYIKDMI